MMENKFSHHNDSHNSSKAHNAESKLNASPEYIEEEDIEFEAEAPASGKSRSSCCGCGNK